MRYRAYRSGGARWSLTGARCVVVTTSHGDLDTDGSVFDAPDGTRYIMKPVGTREEADATAARAGRGARVFAVHAGWGRPAQEWIDADPQFLAENPAAFRR